MKIERFLDKLDDRLLNYPQVDFPTAKLIFNTFTECLSKSEYKRWSIKIQMISEYTLKQITIEEFIRKEKTKNLSNKLKKLKNGVK